jgi:transposase
MDLAKYAVTAVVVEGRSLRAVAASTGRSKSWVGRHVQLYRRGGDEALEPKKRGPVTAKNRTSAVVEDAIVAMRKQLSDEGWDAGARTIQWHLTDGGATAPALATIHRVLQRRGFVSPTPEATAIIVDPLRVPSPQRDLADRHDALATRGRRSRRDRELH